MSSEYKYYRDEKHRLLTVDKVCVSYGPKPILQNVSFHIDDIHRDGIKQGQVVSLLGPSGMGKSQLSRCISGLQKPTSGEVRLNGNTGPVEAGEVGVVMQNYPLLNHRTILGNLTLVAEGKVGQDRAMELLGRFGLADKKDMYPCQLSGGQRQRIAIIQQLLCSTHFIIMDEPFSGLDPIAKDDVCHVLNEISLMDDLNTIIVITHDISCAIAISDTVLMLGRNKDAAGNKLQGASIQTTFDLIDRDLAWHKDVEHQPNFRHTLEEITQTFFAL